MDANQSTPFKIDVSDAEDGSNSSSCLEASPFGPGTTDGAGGFTVSSTLSSCGGASAVVTTLDILGDPLPDPIVTVGGPPGVPPLPPPVGPFTVAPHESYIVTLTWPNAAVLTPGTRTVSIGWDGGEPIEAPLLIEAIGPTVTR